MLRTHRHGDVVQLELSSRRSRLAGFAVNAYLMRGVLIDTGFPGVGEELEQFLASERLQGVIVTHWHEDHAGNVERVARRGIPIAAHTETLSRARLARRIPVYRRFTWGQPEPLVTPVTPFDPEALAVIHTPGHSPDHLAVWDAETRTLFTGDLFIGVKVRVAHHDEEPRRLVASLRRVLALEPQRVFDAHRGPVRDPVSALRAKADWTEALIARVEARAREGVPPARIARELLGPRDSNDYVSRGEYSRAGLIHAILHESHDATDGA